MCSGSCVGGLARPAPIHNASPPAARSDRGTAHKPNVSHTRTGSRGTEARPRHNPIVSMIASGSRQFSASPIRIVRLRSGAESGSAARHVIGSTARVLSPTPRLTPSPATANTAAVCHRPEAVSATRTKMLLAKIAALRRDHDRHRSNGRATRRTHHRISRTGGNEADGVMAQPTTVPTINRPVPKTAWSQTESITPRDRRNNAPSSERRRRS